MENRLAHWTSDEDRYLLANVSKIGHKWTKISAALPGRPLLTCRNRYRALKNLKDSQSTMDDTTYRPSSESSTMVHPDHYRTRTPSTDIMPLNESTEPARVLLDPGGASQGIAFNHHQDSQYGLVQDTTSDWMSPDMGLSPPLPDQHLGPSDDFSLAHMIQDGLKLVLEDSDFRLCPDLLGTSSITEPHVSDTNTYSESGGQCAANFRASNANLQRDNGYPFWDASDSPSWIFQAGSEARTQQVDHGHAPALHIVHHHHVYHHHVAHTSSLE